MSLDARPIRSVSQVAAAAHTTDRRAADILLLLERCGIVEKARGGYRATMDAWLFYPRPTPKEERRAA